jgi:hypothetical protein
MPEIKCKNNNEKTGKEFNFQYDHTGTIEEQESPPIFGVMT